MWTPFLALLSCISFSVINLTETANSKWKAFDFKVGILAVGKDKQLYAKRNLSCNSWIRIPTSCCVIQIHVMKNGVILGVGTNKHLYVKKSLFDPWHHVPHSCCITEITTMRRNGKEVFLGIGTNKKLYMKQSLKARWQLVRRSNPGISIASANNKLISVSRNNQVSVRLGLKGKVCRIPKSSGVRDVFFKQGVLYGVSKDHKIVHKRLPNLQKAGNLWCQALRKSPREWIRNSASCCIDSVGLPKKPIIFRPRIIAVGRDYQMYFKNSVSSPWGFIQKSGPVKSISLLNNGLLVGVGTNHHLYTRSSIDSVKWKLVPRSCCVKSVTQLPNGTIVGVGMANNLWERAGLKGRWRKVPNSSGVMSITSMKDGSILGIGLNRALYMRRSLRSPWKGPIGNSMDVKLIDIKFSVLDDVLYGVTVKQRVVRKVCSEIDSPWEVAGGHNCCVLSIVVS